MNAYKITIGAAVAAVLGSGSAFALDQTTTNAATTTKLVAGGSSAARDAFLVMFANEICNAGTLDVYRANPTANQDFRAYSCHLKTAAALGYTDFGSAADKDVTVFMRAEGGSAWGPVAVATNTQEMALDTTDASCSTATATNFTVGTTVLSAVPTHNCSVTGYSIASDTVGSGALVLKTVDLGISDEEPKMYTGTNWPSSSRFTAANTPANVTALKNYAKAVGFGQMFGVIVNSTGVNTSLISNLTKQDVASILSGVYTDWSQLPESAALGLPGGNIYVARREPGSGTQVAGATYFLNSNCANGYTYVTDSDVPSAWGADNVYEAGATAVMEAQLSTQTDSIGVNVYKSPAPAGTKYVSVNGASPDRTKIGQPYDLAYELTLVKRSGLADNAPSSLYPLSLANGIVSIAKKAALVPDVASTFALPIGTNAAGSTVSGRPVSWGTRSGDSCKPFQAQ